MASRSSRVARRSQSHGEGARKAPYSQRGQRLLDAVQHVAIELVANSHDGLSMLLVGTGATVAVDGKQTDVAQHCLRGANVDRRIIDCPEVLDDILCPGRARVEQAIRLKCAGVQGCAGGADARRLID